MTKITILGGGLAGIIAAINIKQKNPNFQIQIIEHNDTLARKLLVSGASRCNITNINLTPDYYHGDKTFISKIITENTFCQIQKFYQDFGILLYEEIKQIPIFSLENGELKSDNLELSGKIYPITLDSKSIHGKLMSKLKEQKIEILLNESINSVKNENNIFHITTNSKIHKSDKVIIAMGGKSYPQLGATSKGFEIAEKFGHTIKPQFPVAVAMQTKNWILTRLKGQRTYAEVKSFINGKEVNSIIDEILFTPYGISGPAILRQSYEISEEINVKGGKCEVSINFLPGLSKKEGRELLNQMIKKNIKYPILNTLIGIVKPKIVETILKFLKIDIETKVSDLDTKQIDELIELITNWKLEIIETQGYEQAEFMGGGVTTDEINPETMESKLVKNLYFAGEVIDVVGEIGGYNLTWAWSSGMRITI